MLSFSKIVKEELIKRKIVHDHNLIYEFQAMTDLLGGIEILDKQDLITFTTSDFSLMNYYIKLSKLLFMVTLDSIKIDQSFIKPYKYYTVLIHNSSNIIDKISFYQPKGINFVNSLDMKQRISYIRGAFLSCGCITNPHSKNYHLEIKSSSLETILTIQALLNSFDLNARVTQMKKRYVVYIKSVKNISGLLSIIEATKSYLELENIISQKNLTKTIHAKMNLEIANEKRCLIKTQEIISCIRYIENNNIILPDDLLVLSQLRLEYDDMSLSELCLKYKEIYGQEINKSTLYRKFEKIKSLATN